MAQRATYHASRNVTAVTAWSVIMVAIVFYCYAYFLRVSPSTMMPQLLQNFHINATQFGNLSAFYYFAYTPMQLPVGIIIDRFSARMVLFTACLVATVGVLLFVMADKLYVAAIGRFLIGFGTAFAYVSVLKLATLWLPPKRFATVAGLTTAFGMVSAIFSDLYLTKLVEMVGYKAALYSSLIAGLVLSVVIITMVRNHPRRPGLIDSLPSSANTGETYILTMAELFQKIKVILRNPQIWIIGTIGALFYMPASVFLDLWGIPYLQVIYHLSPAVAGRLVSMIFLGWIVASPVIGMVSDRINRRRRPLVISAAAATVIVCIVFYMPGLSLLSLHILLFLLGVFCGAHPLCFALAKENSCHQTVGTTVAITNTLIMLGGVIFQPFVGELLDFCWSGAMQNGVRLYSATSYQIALSILPIGIGIALLLTFFVKETYCRHREQR